MACSHFHKGGERLSCDAFPSGIPEAIIKSEVDHRSAYEGDSGIQFEPSTEFNEEELKTILEVVDAH